MSNSTDRLIEVDDATTSVVTLNGRDQNQSHNRQTNYTEGNITKNKIKIKN
jgi:hypothetical protein